MSIKTPRICDLDTQRNNLVIRRVPSYPTFVKYLWSNTTAEAIASLSDDELLAVYCYYSLFEGLFKMGEVLKIQGYKPSQHRHISHQIAKPELEGFIINEIRKRPELFAYIKKYTLINEIIRVEDGLLEVRNVKAHRKYKACMREFDAMLQTLDLQQVRVRDVSNFLELLDKQHKQHDPEYQAFAFIEIAREHIEAELIERGYDVIPTHYDDEYTQIVIDGQAINTNKTLKKILKVTA